MPLWQFFHPPSAFKTAAERQAVVRDVTRNYTDFGLPAFYVTVLFTETAVDDADNVTAFVGGEPAAANFVRIVVHHLAYHSMGSLEAHARITTNIDRALKPHLADKGFQWEYHVTESAATLWKINGIHPPTKGDPAIDKWVADNKPSPYEGMGGGMA